MTSFASNAAVAIENAALIDELEESKTLLQQENHILKQKSKGKFFVNDIIGSSPKINEVFPIRTVFLIRFYMPESRV